MGYVEGDDHSLRFHSMDFSSDTQREKDYGEETVLTPKVTLEAIAQIKKIIVSNFAGPVAEARAGGDRSYKGDASDSRHSLWMVENIFESDGECEGYLNFLWEQTNHFVLCNWELIKIVAQELLERKKLTFDEVNSLIEGKIATKYIL